jgi:phosphoribosylamine--glycine ligase
MSLKILIIDTGAEALDWAMRCIEWGHEVKWFTSKRDDRSKEIVGQGIVPRLYDYEELWKKWVGWADLIFLCDNTKYIDKLEGKRQIGYPIFGPSAEASELELNRALGQQAMKDAGLNILDGKVFHDYAAAIAFVRKNPAFLVSKPSGEADKALSYVAPSGPHGPDCMHYMLERWSKEESYVKDAAKHGFILQEKIEGVEFAVGGWFGPGGWSRWWYENFEYKKLMVGDLGPNTGEMGTLSMYVRSSKLAEKALKPMTKLLTQLDYTGFIDSNGMIDGKGDYWPFEFTCRPGWPSFHNQVATHLGDPAQWMVDLLHGRDTLKVMENVHCVSVVVAIPDFPYSKITKKKLTGIPVYNAGDREHVHLSEICMGEAPVMGIKVPHIVTCGDYVAVVTGTGETVRGARRSAYAAAKKIVIPNDPFHRPDIGAGRVRDGIPQIQKLGYAKNFVLV